MNGAEADQWNPMEWDRAAEELTWERLLGLDGSLVFLEHVFWVVSLNTLFILIFASVFVFIFVFVFAFAFTLAFACALAFARAFALAVAFSFAFAFAFAVAFAFPTNRPAAKTMLTRAKNFARISFLVAG